MLPLTGGTYVEFASLLALLVMLAAGGVALVGGVAFTKLRAQRYHDAHRRLMYVTFPLEMTPASALAALGSATGLDRPRQVELAGVPSTAFETIVVAGTPRSNSTSPLPTYCSRTVSRPPREPSLRLFNGLRGYGRCSSNGL